MKLTSQNLEQYVDMTGDYEIRGRVNNVYKRVTGKGQNGLPDYSFQNIVVEDDTGKINITLKGMDEEFKHDNVGKEITIQCYKAKTGYTGIKIAKDDKYGIKVTVTKSAKINIVEPKVVEVKEPPKEVKVEPISNLQQESIQTIETKINTNQPTTVGGSAPVTTTVKSEPVVSEAKPQVKKSSALFVWTC